MGEPLKICDGVVIEDAYLSFTEISEKESIIKPRIRTIY